MNSPDRDPLEIVGGRAGTHPSTAPRHAVIWLHGLGADGSDFLPVINEFDHSRLPPTRFIFPHAPLIPVTLNHGHIMPAWHDIFALERGAQEDEAGLRASIAYIDSLITRQSQADIPPENIVLAGFSQGGNVALNCALRYPARLAGALILSSYLGLAAKLAPEASAANRDLPIFMAHGIYDDVVRYDYARNACDTLNALAYPVAWHEYPMRHTLSAPEINDIENWLVGIFRSA